MLSRARHHLSSISKLPSFPRGPKSTPISVHQTIQIIPSLITRHQATSLTSLAYGDLFYLLKAPPNPFEVKRLHAVLLVNGFFSPISADRVLGSQLVSVYVNFGCLREGLLVFNLLPCRSNLAWNAMLRGFVDMGQFSKAIEFYHLMLVQGMNPDNYTYPIVLKACSELNALEEGRRVKDLIVFNEIHRDVKRNIYVECALIDMFGKCGSLVEARHVFDEMPKKDLASWGAMICGTLQNGDWSQAICLFRRMRMDGIHPDSVIVAAILPESGRLGARHLGMTLQGFAVRNGFDSDLYVSNALINMYCKCGCTVEACSVFCNMENRDVVSWSTLIAGYACNCLHRESFELYLEMNRIGMSTNAMIAASILPGLAKLKLFKQGKEMHSYILKQGFEDDVVVGSALIDMYAHLGSVREAEHIFNIMSNKDISIWNSMIVGYSLNGDISLAFGIFQRLWESDLRPNFITLVSMIPMCAMMGTPRQGKEIHGYAIRNGFTAVVSVGNSLIDMYCKCGFLELGLNVLSQMMEKNIVTYNTIIAAHGTQGQAEMAFSYLEQMQEARIRPSKVTFVVLLSACSHAGLVEKGWLLFNSMIDDYNILPEMEHYACIVDLLARGGHLEDAFKFIRQMPLEPDINVLGSLLGACRVHNRFDIAQFIGKEIQQKNTKDSGHYVLLSNIYASTKKWTDASTTRAAIKERSLTKKPGSSWIELGSHVHKFYATDFMHPEFNKLQGALECLRFELKDEDHKPNLGLPSLGIENGNDELFNLDVS
ncbi:putative pentatricopeptide repeat-containing protein [Tripterygium wilfordii]|uniref:Putative pentatricopeptide repeat-containing protein n=1 Tax=Tripterygium wilfordii TaxID=458696 RepID=A0A7J7DBW4_TRIWF|nr:pentatricopeptide repeat-containing protein At3g16610-like [Tripterygium wilfordii]KAF5743852.1 putative pentatricopeptide repeat-containing protein [Tripterygium wilfordii]